MKRPWYDTLLFALSETLALVLIILVSITGVTGLVTGLSIIFVGVGGFYVGTTVEREYYYKRGLKNEA